jgi:hypothetical protein
VLGNGGDKLLRRIYLKAFLVFALKVSGDSMETLGERFLTWLPKEPGTNPFP